MEKQHIIFEQEKILYAVEQLAIFIITHYPQVEALRKMIIDRSTTEDMDLIELPESPDGLTPMPVLNYYFCGSLAVMLLSLADKIIQIDSNYFPGISEGRSITIPDQTIKKLFLFARLIGDLDYVPLDGYKNRQFYTGKIDYRSEEYKKRRLELLFKGGCISLSDVPEAGRSCLKIKEGNINLFVDPVEVIGVKKVVKIIIHDKEFYIASPDSLLGFKILHLLRSYERKSDQFNTDIPILLDALSTVYSREELIQMTCEILLDFNNSIRLFSEDQSQPSEIFDRINGIIAIEGVNPNIIIFLKEILIKLKSIEE